MEPGAASRQFDHGEILEVDVGRLREDFRMLRLERGVSQLDMAALLKVSQATISSFEQGKHDRIRSRTLRGIQEIVSFWRDGIAGDPSKASRSRSVVTSTGPGRSSGRRCAPCGAEIPVLLPEPRYCPYCSSPLGQRCACGHLVEGPDAKYCSLCGIRLNAKSTRPSVSHDVALRSALQNALHRYIDRGDLVDFILSGLHERAPLDAPRP